ncbi:alpha/beta fold hydrolase [Marinomonas sp. PE14-40]|uniref:alpha/beta fold hydrolase n=1 Tax=Marinomonas sp. PE14-40 TaxID=3060621 RepID=UPI003F6710CB
MTFNNLVLLPGMMCDERLFSPQINHLQAFSEVIVPHYGMAMTVNAMAQEVLQQAPDQFALAGLSMGGIVAMEVIRLAPERVKKLALLDTNPRAELKEVQQAREPQIIAVQNGGLARLMQEQMISRYFAEQTHKQPLADICLNMALDLGSEAFIRQSKALQSRPDQQLSLKQVKVPSLILMGQEDQLCPLDRHELLHAIIPHAEFVIVPKAGHLPTLEQPKITNHALEKWLQQ